MSRRSLGVSIKGKDLTQVKLEVQATAGGEGIGSVHIPSVCLVLFGDLLLEIPRLLHGGCPLVLAFKKSVHDLREGLRAYPFGCVDRLKVVPKELIPGDFCRAPPRVALLLRQDLTDDLFTHLLPGQFDVLIEHLVGVADRFQHHSVSLIQILQLGHSHAANGSAAHRLCKRSKMLMHMLVVCLNNVTVLRIFQLCVSARQVVKYLGNLGFIEKHPLLVKGFSQLGNAIIQFASQFRNLIDGVIACTKSLNLLQDLPSLIVMHLLTRPEIYALEAFPENLLVGVAFLEKEFGRLGGFGDEVLHVFLDIPLLITSVEDLIQFPDGLSDLLPHLGSCVTLRSALQPLGSFCLYLGDALISLLLHLSADSCPLTIQHILQGFRSLKAKQLLVDVGDLVAKTHSFVLECDALLLGHLLSVRIKLAVDLLQPGLHFLDLCDVLLVLVELVLLPLVLRYTLQGIGENRAGGEGLGGAVGIQFIGMIRLVLFNKPIHNALRYREVAVTTLVVIQHPHCLVHVELRLYGGLRTSDAIVIVHLEVNQQFPIAIGRAVCL